jgi:hypothetical protein
MSAVSIGTDGNTHGNTLTIGSLVAGLFPQDRGESLPL